MSDQTTSFLSRVLIIWFLALCFTHYLSERPLWLDEGLLFKSIETYSTQELFTQKLSYNQVFPRTYLWCIQKLSQVFDFHVLSLRLFPLLSMLTAFFLWIQLARRHFTNNFEYIIYLLSWVACPFLVYYSAELKQYSMDVLVGTVFLTYFSCMQHTKGKKLQYLRSTRILPVLVLFSHTTYLYLIFPFVYLIDASYKDKRTLKYLLSFLFSVAIFVSISYMFDVRHPKVNVLDKGLGSYYLSFESANAFFKPLGEGLTSLFGKWFVTQPKFFRQFITPYALFTLIAFIYAFFAEVRKNKMRSSILHVAGFVLLVELVVLAILKKYPFIVMRTTLFMCPLILMFYIRGISSLKKIHPYVYCFMFGIYVLFLIVTSVLMSKGVLMGGSPFDAIL